MKEKWAIVLEANPFSWRLLKRIGSASVQLNITMPAVYVLENRCGDVVAFVLDTTKMLEEEEEALMEVLPYDKRPVPHLP